MKHARRFAGVTALMVAALAASGAMAGVAAAAGSSPSVNGMVTAVNGDTTVGVCGTAGGTGSFTLTSAGAPDVVRTVDVTGATAFVEKKVAAPTFANVCVGDRAGAIGVQTGFVVDASAVSVTVPKSTHAFGTVTSVNSVTTAGTCGTAGADGSFTVSTLVSGVQVLDTVFVTPSTKFTSAHVPHASFVDVCVGYKADADGLTDGNSILADSVHVHPPAVPTPIHLHGMVTSVGGVSTAATCGIAGDAGSFVVTWTSGSVGVVNTTVDVTSTTPFSGKSGVTSFADVCVGSKSSVIGNYSSGALDALAVATYPIKA